MIIDINFFYGGIGKYRRNRETKYKTEENTIIKDTMFHQGYGLSNLASVLRTVDNVEEISYQEYSSENLFNEGNAVFFYNPPRKFPEKTFKGIPIRFSCIFCGNNKDGTGHSIGCTMQNKNLLICHDSWVSRHRQSLKNADLIDRNGDVLYTKFNNEFQDKRPTVVNRITIKRKYGNSYAYFHIFDNLRIRIEKLPFTTNWKRDAKWIIEYLNLYGSDLFKEKMYFDEEMSFVSQIVENKRLFDKNDNSLKIKVDSTKIKDSKITKYKTRLGEENKYNVNVTKKYFSFNDVFLSSIDFSNIDEGKKKYYKKFFEEIGKIVKEQLLQAYNEKRSSLKKNLSDYNNVFEQNFIELSETIHSTGALQRFYKTVTFEDTYLNILFIECVDKFKLPDGITFKDEESKRKFKERQNNFVKSFVENFKLENYYQQQIQMTKLEELDKYIISNREIKFNSVKNCLKLEKEPPVGIRNSQPFNRGLFPYSFKGRVLFPGTVINHIGKKKDNLYYPICVKASSTKLKTYIKALIQGFPKDQTEAEKYGIDWNNGNPKDDNSAVKPFCEIQKDKYVEIERNGRVIKPLGIIDIEKFKKCAKEKSSVIDGSIEVNTFEFSFLQPLTIDILFTISNKKLSAQAIPEESLISYCHNKRVYYMFKGKTLMAPFECRENGHGYIHNKRFISLNFRKCERKENILQYCESKINRSLRDNKIDKIIIFTEEGEGFYWNSNGYKELRCNVNLDDNESLFNVSMINEDSIPFPIKLEDSIQVNNKKKYGSTLKEFPRQFFYQENMIRKNNQTDRLRRRTDKTMFGGNEVLVNGIYNDFGKIYWGTPLNQVERKAPGLYKQSSKPSLTLGGEDYKQKIQQIISKSFLNKEDLKKCFRRKNIENFIKIASPIEVDFFTKSSTLTNLNLKLFKINVPFSNENNLKDKIEKFTRQFINKTINKFEQSAVIFYDDGNSIKYHYSQ